MTTKPTPALALACMMTLGQPWGFALAQSLSPTLPPAAQAASDQVLHLSASAQTEVAQDWLVMTLVVQKEGLQAPVVQKQLNAVLSTALAVAKPLAKPGAVEVSTGEMNVTPRYGREGKTTGWTGSAQLLLQGRDAVQIATLAARVQELTVAQIGWHLSPEQKSAAESRIQAEAVAGFQSKAKALTQQFGFAAYTLREVRVSAQETGGVGIMPRMAMASMDAAPAPMPTLAGKSHVVVNVSGSIVLR